jgi:hypothetical protein
MVLPTMGFRKETKTGNEVALYYNLGIGIIKKRLFNGGSTVVTSCGGSNACPANSFDATVLTSVLADDQPAFGTMPANSPLFTAVEGEQSITTDGVFADLVCLPDPANDVLICFDQGFEASLGATFRAVPRKYDVADHYVRQRSENSIRISDFFVSNWAGIQRIRGRRVTIIAKIFPQGGGQPSEIQYYSNVLLNVSPLNYGNDGNANIEINGEGAFNFAAIFAQQPS